MCGCAKVNRSPGRVGEAFSKCRQIIPTPRAPNPTPRTPHLEPRRNQTAPRAYRSSHVAFVPRHVLPVLLLSRSDLAAVVVAACLGGVLIGSCANPQPPGGGPRDETPPRVVSSTPASDAVNIRTRSVRIVFSEYVERTSLIRSLTVTPAFDRALEFDWDGRAVEITFPSALRDSTTYILTLDAELSDTRGVSLNNPITIAFSTGPRINRGRIAGRVVEPAEGRPQPQVDIYAYGAPDGVPPTPFRSARPTGRRRATTAPFLSNICASSRTTLLRFAITIATAVPTYWSRSAHRPVRSCRGLRTPIPFASHGS